MKKIKESTVYPFRERTFTVTQLLESQAKLTPSNIAVIYKDKQLTYEHLHQQANQWAHYLREKGVTRNTVVAVYMPRCIELVIMLIAILKAGGAYLPIDYNQPSLRVRKILQDSKAKFCIAQNKVNCLVDTNSLLCKFILIDEITSLQMNFSKLPLTLSNLPEDLSYVIYTSGSTGEPKGVANIHRGTANMLLFMKNKFKVNIYDKLLQKASVGFDLSVPELFLPLIAGAATVLTSDDDIDVTSLVNTINRYNISLIHFVPSQFSVFSECEAISTCKSIRIVICIGEPLLSKYCTSFFKLSSATLYNSYGPTESSVYASFYKCRKKYIDQYTIVPIGKPMANYKFFVVNKEGKIAIRGEVGELCIAGIGLAQGYWNNLNLTQKKFINLKISPTKTIRAYKTGDLVLQQEDGNFKFIERIDDQIKLRGFRIELAEVEAAILKHPAITQATVKTVITPSGTNLLVAYIVIKMGNQTPTSLELSDFLTNQLPNYMIPSQWIVLDSLPLTISGKLNKNSLPMPTWEENKNPELVQNGLENKLIKLWQQVLKIKSVGIHDNFFSLGADSIKAIMISALAQRENINIRAQWIMLNPTIASLAQYITSKTNSIGHANAYIGIFQEKCYQSRMREMLATYGVIENIKNIEAIYPTTPMQQGILFHSLQSPAIGMYLNHIIIELEGDINQENFQLSWEKLLQKHAILRTGFYFTEFNQPLQIINHIVSLRYHFKDIKNFPPDNQKLIIENYLANLRSQGFNLDAPPLWEVALFKTDEAKYRMIYTDHHSIADGMSQGKLLKEFVQTYSKYHSKKVFKLDNTNLFVDYCGWLQQQDKVSAKTYWSRLLKPIEEPTVLDIDNYSSHSTKLNIISKEHIKIVNKKLSKSLASFAKQYGVTINSVIQTAWTILISKYCRGRPLVYGLIESGRAINMNEVTDCVGLMVQTFPIVISLESNIIVLQLIKNIQKQTIDSSHYNYYPLTDMHSLTNLAKQTPLFRYAITFLDYTVEQLFSPSLELENVKVTYLSQSNQTHYPLLIIISKVKENLVFRFSYSPEHFNATDIKLLSKRWHLILEEITKDATRLIKDIPVLLKEEKNKILYEWNNTIADFPKDKTIVQLFEQQAQINFNKTAIIFNDEKITYKSLNQQANQLAHYLRKVGVKPEVIVAIYLERSPHYIISMLAISKAGGVYLPIDKQLPAHRINYLLSDSKASLLISHSSLQDKLDNCLSVQEQDKWKGKLIYLDTDKNIYNQSTDNLLSHHTSQNAIYIMYTSGSTGNPKGVVVEHSAFTNCLYAIQEEIKLDKHDRWLALTSFSFDIAQMETFLPLAEGGNIILANETERREPSKIKSLIETYNVTIIQATPSFWQVLLYLNISQIKMICTGERLTFSLAKQLQIENNKVWNLYGPTEATIWCMAYKLCRKFYKNDISIGKPLANNQAYILDENLQLLPIGAIGELYISGSNLARGYLNKNELTEQKYVINPQNLQAGLMYKTGDLARWHYDGNIELKGRIDEQIKLRGFRIEPGEIENALVSMPFINEAKVIMQNYVLDGKEHTQLVAYIIANKELTEVRNIKESNQLINQWHDVYEKIYENNVEDNEFNIIGWKNSYTGKCYSREEMLEWRDNTVNRILKLDPRKILEIGSGTGLLLFPLANYCEEYTATDFSSTAILSLAKLIKNRHYFSDIQIKHCAAHNIFELKENYYDTVIINSVVQYFPNESYLRNVIHQAIQRIKPNGQLFIGDVRNLDSIELFHTALQLAKAYNNVSLHQLYSTVIRGVQQEKELVISPSFFYSLIKDENRISSVEILLKEGKFETEMNQFRYDVVLHIDKPTTNISINWIEWQDIKTLNNLEVYLQNTSIELIPIRGIPNARLSALRDIFIQQEQCGDSLIDWKQYIKQKEISVVSVFHLINIISKYKFNIYLTFSLNNPEFVNLIIYNQSNINSADIGLALTKNYMDKLNSNYTNDPFYNLRIQQLNQSIIVNLTKKLPDYMIPNYLIWLSKFPLTSNGKIDKKHLPLPRINYLNNDLELPSTKIQNHIANIWRTVLGINLIGINDNFFTLGGHSISAMQIATTISKHFCIKIPISYIYQAPTIKKLSVLVNNMLIKQQDYISV